MSIVKKVVSEYGYKEEDFACIETKVYADRMNDGWYEITKERVIVPKEFKDKVHYATVNFTQTAIVFYDKNDYVLFETVGEGYDDIEKPKAFFVEYLFQEEPAN